MAIECTGGSIITNQFIHTLDLMHLFKGQPTTYTGELLNITDYAIEVKDTSVANDVFENGVKEVWFATSAYAVHSSVEVEVITERRRFVSKAYSFYEYRYNTGMRILIAKDDIFEEKKTYYEQGQQLAIKSFYKAILEATDDYIDIEKALGSMQMIDLLKK